MAALEIPEVLEAAFELHKTYFPDVFYSSLEYKPRPDDVFLVDFPKCGQTWLNCIIQLLFRQGEPMDCTTKISNWAPSLEQHGRKFVENFSRPCTIRTHFPFDMIPWSEDAKYIHITRNPKDCCVSYYHFMINFPGFKYNGSFDHFFELFMAGKTMTGDYFDHLLTWYPHRNDPNVLFVAFEELKEDFNSAILKVASFIDDAKYAEPIRRNPEILSNIKKYSSAKEMDAFLSKMWSALDNLSIEELRAAETCEITKCILIEAKKCTQNGESVTSYANRFVRKGVIGDWKNCFSEDQNRRLEEKIEEKLGGTDIAKSWKERY